MDSVISGALGGGSASTFGAFGLAISSTARPAIAVMPPVFGPSIPPSDNSITAASSAGRERHAVGVSQRIPQSGCARQSRASACG